MANEQQPSVQAMQYTFIPEDPSSKVQNTTKPPNQKQKRTEITKKACVFCRLRHQRCQESRPCKECLEKLLPCLRDTSLCLAEPTRNDTQFKLSDKIFQQVQNTLNYFQDECAESFLNGYETVSVNWETPDRKILSTWSERLYRLHTDRIDATVKNVLADKAHQVISISQLEWPGRFEPLYDDPLYKDAYVMFKLFAAIETISRSLLEIQHVHKLLSRFVIFLVLTVYAMKISEVSMSFVSRLYGAIQNNRLDESQMQWAVEIYSQLIKRLASFQNPDPSLGPDSFLSDLFYQIQPRLNGIQTRVDKILSTLPREKGSVFPISELPPFLIRIRISSEWTPLISKIPVGDLLRRDFHVTQDGVMADTISGLPISEGTIDPRVLEKRPPSEPSSTLISATDAGYGFSAPGGSHETNATSMDWHDTDPSTYSESYFSSASSTVSDADQKLLGVGKQF